MFHPDAQTLISTWTALARSSAVPDRRDFDPVTLGRLLPQAFMADRRGDGARFRLAGDWIERVHGHAVAGTDWLALWGLDSHPLVALSLAQTVREARPVVLVAEARGEPLEIVLTPMRGPDGVADRILGLYAPTTASGRELRDIGPLTARLSVGVGDIRRAPLQLAALDGRRIA